MNKQLLKNTTQKAIETRFSSLKFYTEIKEVTAVFTL